MISLCNQKLTHTESGRMDVFVYIVSARKPTFRLSGTHS